MNPRISVCAWVLGDEPDPVGTLAGAGFESVELDAGAGFDAASLRASVDAHGVGVAALCAEWTLERDLASPDKRLREAAAEHLRRSLEWADVVGSPGVIVVPTFRTDPDPGDEPTAAVERAAATIRDACTGYGRDRPWLAVEPLNRTETYLVRTLRQAADLVDRVGEPGVGLLADSYHMLLEESSPVEALDAHADMVLHVHLADHDRRTPGSGRLDLYGFLKTLRRRGYTAGVGLEPYPASIPELVLGGDHVERLLGGLPHPPRSVERRV